MIVNNFSMGVSVTGRELNSRLCFNETFYERVVRVGVFVRNILATIALRLVLGRVYLPQILR